MSPSTLYAPTKRCAQAEIERYIEQNQIPDDVVHPLTRPDA
jgi:hypothetical protein